MKHDQFGEIMTTDAKTTHFGFQTVDEDHRARMSKPSACCL
ncbi:MAG: hypothetical protein AAF393_03935 [Pseudomonadota bacterium]